jgi:hypothetical protein
MGDQNRDQGRTQQGTGSQSNTGNQGMGQNYLRQDISDQDYQGLDEDQKKQWKSNSVSGPSLRTSALACNFSAQN